MVKACPHHCMSLGLLKHTLHLATPKVKETAYNMLVRSKLEQETIAWNPYTQNNIDTLEKIQRSAARFTLIMTNAAKQV